MSSSSNHPSSGQELPFTAFSYAAEKAGQAKDLTSLCAALCESVDLAFGKTEISIFLNDAAAANRLACVYLWREGKSQELKARTGTSAEPTLKKLLAGEMPFSAEGNRCAVPMRSLGKIVGVWQLVSEARPWSPHETGYVSFLANYSGAAIQSIRVPMKAEQPRTATDPKSGMTYAIAHDLKSPLRAIRNFSKILSEDYGASLDANGKDLLERVISGATRMDGLIQGLLEYGKLETSDVTPELVDLDMQVDVMLMQWKPEVQKHKATLEVIRPLGKVTANPIMLEHVLAQLLANALKFHQPGKPPRIRILSERTPGRVRIGVRDEGIGVDHAYHERIFQLFERLHAHDSYPGYGIGLAIVQKALQRMGGSCVVESAPNSGSTFWIEIPQQD